MKNSKELDIGMPFVRLVDKKRMKKDNGNMRIVVTPDKEYAAEMKKKIKENNGHCPCKVEKTPDTKCMCKEFRDQIERNEPGVCHCGLYFAERED